MNRQLVSFLSLFSLVLVLSIYYVMMPFKAPEVDIPVNMEQEDTTDAYFVSLEIQKNSAYEQLLDEQNAILASSSATMDEKTLALETIAELEEKIKTEANTVASIIEAGYPAAYVEEYDQGIKVVVYKNNPTKEDAATVMGLVVDKFGMDYLPEIRFYA